MRLLCLDCGNTRVKWALHDGSGWVAQGAEATARVRESGVSLPSGLTYDRILAANVAGQQVADALAHSLARPILWNTPRPHQSGVVNGYGVPEQLGADRWAALIGARHLCAGPCLVVCAGTAITVDGLAGDGRFLGGLILPGLHTMGQAMAASTAQLPADAGESVDWPTRTTDAMASGSLEAAAGAIERQFRRLPDAAMAVCLLSGGDRERLAPRLQIPIRLVDHLVLEGLACIGMGETVDL